jgi:2-polyprenyl-3-methyl-5-hydroxy-6-metoxy-1,4-benzoquinol methylase
MKSYPQAVASTSNIAGRENSITEPVETEYRGLKIHATPYLHDQCMMVIKGIGLPENARALDLGAGEGAFSQRMIDEGFKVSAAEFEVGRFKVDAPCQNIDLNIDFQNKWSESFDLVVAIEILEHLHNPRHFISNCLGALKSDGYLLITSPNVESWLSRIKFLRNGRFLWFDESDYHAYGHLTPIFSWQIRQICREMKAELVQVSNTKNSLLRKRLGNRPRHMLKNKSFYLGVLYPFMKGMKEGEISIYLIRKSQAGAKSDTASR